MITAPYYQNKRIGVFGLARTGIAAVHALVASGAKVLAWDDNEVPRTKVGDFAADLYSADFTKLDALLLAPGVPLTHPTPHAIVKKAIAANVPLISDLDVFQAARHTLSPHKTVAITGTNGKSTTTALIHHIISSASKPAAIGGNIGTGVLSLEQLPKGGAYVFELSSFQLELTSSFDADVAVLLNITPDHLDRHGDMASYVAAKKRLFDMQSKMGTAVISIDDEYGLSIAADCKNKVIPFSVCRQVDGGVYVKDAHLIDDTKDKKRIVGDLGQLKTLQGEHNWQNAAAALAACRALGIKSNTIFNGLKTFPGLAHRQEIVPFHDSITVVNDSKATNVDAAMRALKTFPRIRWIAGGRSKDRNFGALSNCLSSVRKAYLMGEHGADIAAILPSNIERQAYDKMSDAVEGAIKDAESGDTVLLSPACTAFDQFADFEKRGEAFKAQINSMNARQEDSQ